MTDADSHAAPKPVQGDRPGGVTKSDAGVGTHFNDLLGLVIGYAKQETIGPLKNLWRYVAWGVAGVLLFSVGGLLAVLAAVRCIQFETVRHLHGDWNWVPYFGGVLLAALGVAWALSHIVRGDKALKEPAK